MSSPTLSCQSLLLLVLPDRVHGRTVPAVLAVPPVAIEENQVGGCGVGSPVIHPKELHHCRSCSAGSLRIELADAHEPRGHADAIPAPPSGTLLPGTRAAARALRGRGRPPVGCRHPELRPPAANRSHLASPPVWPHRLRRGDGGCVRAPASHGAAPERTPPG